MLVRGMRMVNTVLIGVAAIGLLAAFEVWRTGGAIYSLLGASIWLAPLFLTRQALGQNANAQAVRTATIANFVLMGFCGVGLLGGFVRGEAGTTANAAVARAVPVLIFAGLIVLNLRALSRRTQDLALAASSAISPRDAVFTIGSDIPSAPAAVSQPAEPPARGRYVMRHWRGQLPLPVSYWINGTLVATLLGMALPALGKLFGVSDSLRQLAMFSILAICVVYLSWVWSFVGIWRSAGRHAMRGGSTFWAYAARGSVLLGVCAAVGQMVTTYGPELREFAALAMGRDAIGEVDVKPSPNGEAVIVWGTLREGSAKTVLTVLDRTPSARTLILNSNGGRLLEGRVLAQAVRQRGLNTYVEGECSSACTYVLMAGVDRAATPNAKIGFHRASFSGMDSAVEGAAVKSMLDYYRKAGLPEDFVRRVSTTPADTVWYPSREELLRTRILTRVALRSEAPGMLMQVASRDALAARLKTSPLYRAFDQRFPGAVDRAAERAWAVKTRGGTDTEMGAALRGELKQAMPGLLRQASDDALTEFVKLLAAETNAARNIGVEACSHFLEGTLDTSNALPPVLVEEETKTIVMLLNSPPQKPRQQDPYMADAMMRVALQNLTKDQSRALTDKAFGARQPEARCEATLKFYRNVAAMPRPAQSAVLWSMYRR
ncbi:hypothetical protein CUPL110328_14265 [Cupriavidus plantarum]|nr:hypothetical protein LMG26296_03559 [Cupriavidus plantarum]SMR85928.1 hypothetical protein SAMN05421735_4745 [Cupriavidus plantarum]